MRTRLSILASALALAAAPRLGAQSPAPDPVPAHDSFTVASKALGEARRIVVHVPASYRAGPAGARLPVLYMPDGGIDEDFPHVVRVVDSLIAARAIRPVIVVGIPNTQRRRDLTGPTRIGKDSTIAPRVGGSAAFRRFVREELIPAIDARYRTTRERGIVGESLAGLFVVESFLLEPGLFDHHVALDPSLWWNAGALLDAAPARLRAREARGRRTLFLAASKDDVDGNTAQLAGILRALAPAGLRWKFAPRADVTHATIYRALEAEALASALR